MLVQMLTWVMSVFCCSVNIAKLTDPNKESNLDHECSVTLTAKLTCPLLPRTSFVGFIFSFSFFNVAAFPHSVASPAGYVLLLLPTEKTEQPFLSPLEVSCQAQVIDLDHRTQAKGKLLVIFILLGD